MDISLLSYFSLIASLVGLGFSIYAVKKVSQLKVEPKPVPMPKPTGIPLPRLVRLPRSVDVVEPTIVETELAQNVPTKIEAMNVVVKPKKIDGSINDWYLEATGPEGKQFNVHIEWSDGSSDIAGGTVPVELEFSHPRGLTPIKIVGIPPNGDEGVHYLWELNGFHWS